MSEFRKCLKERQTNCDRAAVRQWFYVPYDQLNLGLFTEARDTPGQCGFLFLETPSKAGRRPYHKQKLAYVLANQRHFALECAERGIAVDYRIARSGQDEADTLRDWCKEQGRSLLVQEPAERELRQTLVPLIESGELSQRAHPGWLSTTEQFVKACPQQPYRMDAFYRLMRKTTGLLIVDGKPEGGKWSHDADNRKPWKGKPPAPERLTFPLDPLKQEVGALIESRYADHPGQLDLPHLPATAADAETAWEWAKRECMQHFGPYEDAISERSSGLFHTRISPLLNLHRLMPSRVVREVAEMDAPLNSREGFVRQVLGWREFVRHVHAATDGFADFELSQGMELPPVFWGGAPSGLRCLDQVIEDVWREGYSHHITRLMVLGNLATLLEVSPRQLSDWFWVAYTDAYDWVVEPNVLGMATWATAGVMTTKPYISGAAYLNRMGDSCRSCDFDPKKDCPITRLYWAWLGRHAEDLSGNPRMAMPLRSLAKRPKEQCLGDVKTYERTRQLLDSGKCLSKKLDNLG